MPKTPQGESYQFFSYNRGKKSITLNLKDPKGAEIAKKLAAKVDVLVENFAPGGMERLGLSYEEVSKINPRIIYASISGFGQTGPRRNDVSYDVVAQAMGGLMSVTGYSDGEPLKAGISLGDYMGGYNGVIAILAALYYRTVTGEGQEHVSVFPFSVGEGRPIAWFTTVLPIVLIVGFAAFFIIRSRKPNEPAST